MNPLLWIIGLGAAGYFVLSRSSPGTPPLAATQQQSAAAANAMSAQQMAQWSSFNDQANAIGLSQGDAQQAWDIGLSPQEYVDSGLQGTAAGS